MSAHDRGLKGPSIVIGSRCAWTMHNFRGNLIRRLRRQGWQIVAVGADLDGFETKLRDEAIDFRTVPLPMTGVSLVGDLRLFWSLLKLFRQVRPQVSHMFTIKPVIYGTLAAAAAGVPRRVCTVTGLGHAFTDGGRLVRFVAETLYRLALSQAHVVFFQNDDDRDLFLARRLVRAAQVRMVPGSGVDLERFRPAPLPGGARLRFLMIARLLREKGVMEFIDAAERLAAAGAHAEFRLLGAEDTNNPSRLSPAEMRRLRDSPVQWLGASEDVPSHIAQADVVVLPSYREGTPRVLLEAMAMARPIVTTDAVGCRQLVDPGVNGWRVKARDAQALAHAMTDAVGHAPLLPAMGLAARRFVEDNYSETVVLDRFVASYADEKAAA